MKVVWISHSGSPRGGAELSLCEAAKGLVAKSVDLHVVLPSRGDLAERLKSIGVDVDVKFFPSWIDRGGAHLRLMRLAYNVRVARELARNIDSIGADVVVSNTLATPVGALAARFARRPHVWYVHEFFSQPDHGIYFDFGNRLSLSFMNRLSDVIIVNSQGVLNEFKKWIPPDKLRQIYYGIEVPAFKSNSNHERRTFNLIHAGVLAPGKRQEDAIRAIALLAKRGLDVGLTLLGDEVPKYGPRLRNLCNELGVERRVEFVPFSAEPFSHIAAADCLVMCSKGEAFGRVTVEAMKLGKPVVGAESGGTAELIRDGETGLLFRAGDAEDLAAKVEQLYYDRSLLNEMGLRAQKWANENFNVEKYANELTQILSEVIRRRTDSPSTHEC